MSKVTAERTFYPRYRHLTRGDPDNFVSTLIILRDTAQMTEEAILMTADDFARFDRLKHLVPENSEEVVRYFRENPQALCKDYLDYLENPK
jgi:hypothetical protein